MHVTLVHVQVKPDRVDDFIAATKANHEGSVAEPGNRRFDVLQDPTDPTKFVLYEAYVSAGEAAKQRNGHFLAWREAVEDMMAAPQGHPDTGLFPKV